MLDLAAAHGLPAPEVNAWVTDRYIADFLWRAERVIVEADSDLFHRSATARRADARRDHDLRRNGFAVVRCHQDDVAGAPADVAAGISAALLDRRLRPLR
jgi:very-short-patch-repair endonuclease